MIWSNIFKGATFDYIYINRFISTVFDDCLIVIIKDD